MSTSSQRKPPIDDVHVAFSVEEALADLAAHRGSARLIAGGTALKPLIASGACAATHWVDVSQVCSMKRIVVVDDYLVIGGSVTLALLASSPLVRDCVPMLHEAARAQGGEGMRAAATLVGQMVAAEGSAEGSVALVALNAEAQIVNLTGSQWLPVASLFVRSGVSRVDSTAEIVTAVRVPLLAPTCGTAIGWIERPGPEQPSPLVLALVLALDGDALRWGSVALGTPAGIPGHVQPAEEALSGARVTDPNTRERLARLVAAAGADAMHIDEETRAVVGDTILRLAEGCYGQALAAARAGAASSDGPQAT